jgi:hypothetical protein
LAGSAVTSTNAVVLSRAAKNGAAEPFDARAVLRSQGSPPDDDGGRARVPASTDFAFHFIVRPYSAACRLCVVRYYDVNTILGVSAQRCPRPIGALEALYHSSRIG